MLREMTRKPTKTICKIYGRLPVCNDVLYKIVRFSETTREPTILNPYHPGGVCNRRSVSSSESDGIDLRFQDCSLGTCQEWISRSLLRGKGLFATRICTRDRRKSAPCLVQTRGWQDGNLDCPLRALRSTSLSQSLDSFLGNTPKVSNGWPLHPRIPGEGVTRNLLSGIRAIWCEDLTPVQTKHGRGDF